MLKEKKLINTLTMEVLSSIGDATADELISALLETDLVMLTDAADSLEDVIVAGMLEKYNTQGKTKYTLSEKGKMILPELAGLIPQGILKDAKNAAVKYIEFERNKDEYSSEISPVEDGYILECTYKNASNTICSVRLFFEEELEAIKAKKNFENRYKTVVNAVRAVVTGNVDFMM